MSWRRNIFFFGGGGRGCVREEILPYNTMEGVFRSNFFFYFNTVALSFVFYKYCLIMD
jgi:hypothetical protein